MKNKYQRMTKEEKKALIIEYKKDSFGSAMIKRLTRLLIIGILSYAYAIFLVVTAENIWHYISASGLLIAGCVFIIGSLKLKIKNLNTFAIKKIK